eukprot:TRINITY_DN17960_c0_g1_i1.p1 TRINITY_DN17960_c0_g1~~TRINITY_DN17960_c0_g1_i1.p1  ORF type:complete len:186 (+),score=29.16 TRINITY_DN17960_c0_g1_i1:144-701(+)
MTENFLISSVDSLNVSPASDLQWKASATESTFKITIYECNGAVSFYSFTLSSSLVFLSLIPTIVFIPLLNITLLNAGHLCAHSLFCLSLCSHGFHQVNLTSKCKLWLCLDNRHHFLYVNFLRLVGEVAGSQGGVLCFKTASGCLGGRDFLGIETGFCFGGFEGLFCVRPFIWRSSATDKKEFSSS